MNELLHTYSTLTSGSPTRIAEVAANTGGATPLHSWEPTNTGESDPYFDVQTSIVTAGGLWESPVAVVVPSFD